MYYMLLLLSVRASVAVSVCLCLRPLLLQRTAVGPNEEPPLGLIALIITDPETLPPLPTKSLSPEFHSLAPTEAFVILGAILRTESVYPLYLSIQKQWKFFVRIVIAVQTTANRLFETIFQEN